VFDGDTVPTATSTARKEPAIIFGAPRMTQPGPARKYCEPVPLAAVVLGGQEAQEVDLLADLRHQRQDNRGRGAEADQVEIPAPDRPFGAPVAESMPPNSSSPESLPVGKGNEEERQDVQDDPERLGRELKPADPGDAVGDQRNDGNRAEI
jgi:hypothetical protein